MSCPEQALIEGICNGNVDSMAAFLDSRRRDLLAVILSKMGPVLRSKVEAEDIYQEVAGTVVKDFASVKFDDRGPFGWICEVADRKIVDSRRKFNAQKRDSSKEIGLHGNTKSDDVELINLLVNSITSPSRAFSKKQKEFRMLSAMEKLSLEQQKVLDLRYVKGKSNKDIAQSIGKTDGATRVLIARTLSKLRSLVDDEAEA